MRNEKSIPLCPQECGCGSEIKQIGFVTRDLDRAMAHIRCAFGLEPVGVAETPDTGNKTYGGQPEDFCAKMAFYRFGEMDVEVIQPLRGRSVWENFLREKGEGLHHIQVWTKNFAATRAYLEASGMPMLQGGESFRYPGAEFGYFDATSQLGYYIEVFNPEECGY